MSIEPPPLDRLYREEGPCVWAYLRRRIADVHDAEEMFQQAFLIVAKEPGRASTATSPRAWLIGIAHNLVLEYLRRKQRTRRDTIQTDVAAPARDADDERVSAMRQAIGNLSALHREVVELRLVDELSYADIAEVLNVPVGTIRSRIHHAVRQLRQELVPDEAAASSSRTVAGGKQ
jgi:RNA polymerase sigma-70 factor (ECF subfamily)